MATPKPRKAKSIQIGIWFDRALWRDAKTATAVVNERESLNLTTSEFVRRALRREIAAAESKAA